MPGALYGDDLNYPDTMRHDTTMPSCDTSHLYNQKNDCKWQLNCPKGKMICENCISLFIKILIQIK